MANKQNAFGIYSSEPELERAVDLILENGFAGEAVLVLHPKNENTVEFARRKHTHVPAGTGDGPTANLPLDGSIGLADPVGSRRGIMHWLIDPLGPREGALHGALEEMGVPDEWCHKRVVKGKFLLSVKCNSWDKLFRATGMLVFTGAEDVSSSTSMEEYRAKRSAAAAGRH